MPSTEISGFIAESTDYVVRVLPAEDWPSRAEELGYPTLPDPAFSFLIVVEKKATGKIVGSWTAFTATILEGLSIKVGHRNLVEVQGLLFGGMMGMLASLNIRHPLTVAQTPGILALAEKAGFAPIAGTLLKLE